MKNPLAILVALSLFLFSCKKDFRQDNEAGPALGRGAGGSAGGDDAATFPYGVLGLNSGTFTINSSNNLTADIGYGSGVTSNTNQKINNFNGTSSVHSNVASFVYASSTYQPTGGITRNDPVTDSKLDQANSNAIAASATYAALPPDVVLGNVTSSKTINSVAHNTVVQMSSVDYNSGVLTLVGTPGLDDGFIINVSGNFDFSQSEIRLINVRPERVIFNFPNPSVIMVNKASTIFRGTILAPTGNVTYHNPASFQGAIAALNISLHSNFNLTQKAFIY